MCCLLNIVGAEFLFIGFGQMEVFLLLIVVGIICFFIYNRWKKKHDDSEDEAQFEFQMAMQRFERNKRQAKYEAEKGALIEKYGEPDKAIALREHDLSKEIIAFAKAKRVWIMGHDLKMSDIINFSYVNNQRIEEGSSYYETRTDRDNMINRSIIGGLLFGKAGAVIGGATAKRETVLVSKDDDVLIHDYIIIVNVNSLSNPVINIHVGNDTLTANEIIGLLNVIVSRINVRGY